MCFPPPHYWQFRSRIPLVLVLCVLGAAVFAQETPPTGQLPEDLRNAKIYKLPTKGGQPAPNPVVYKSITFRDINFDRLLLGLNLSVKPVDRSATVERIYFQDVQINGIPVHIETFDQEFKLSNKETIDLPAPLQCAITFADLDSMQPVRDMVDKDTILVTGQSFIEVKLNSLEKLALRAKQLVIPVNLNEQVPLNLFQGNPLLRMTAETILSTLANPASAAAANMAKEHLAKMHLDDSLGGKVKPALYLLCTQYSVRDPKSKASEQYSQCATGFLATADGKLVTTKRAMVPWKYDPQIDFLLEHQHLELDQGSVKTYAWPAGAQVLGADGQPNFQSALSTDKQSLKVVQMPPDEMVQQDYQDSDSGEKATLHLDAEGLSDLAILQLTGTSFQPLALADPAASVGADSKLTLCSYPYGISQPQSAPRLLSVQVSPQGDLLKMEHKTDPGETGAPLLDANGKVVGLVTSASQCLPIQAARKLLP
jgi:hypothetical protein